MNKLALIAVIIVTVLIWSCGQSDSSSKTDEQTNTETQSVEKKEPKLPEGYPAELTVPPGYKASSINTGSGSSSGMGGDRTFKSYELWEMMPKNAAELISHYKNLLAELKYEGEWKGNEKEGTAWGTFTKGQNELELSISSEQFKFNLKVWDK